MRFVVVGAVLAATVVVLLIWGIGLTSALVELAVFAAGLIAWASAGPPAAGEAKGATVTGVVSGRGRISVRQRAAVARVCGLFARKGVTIEQEDPGEG